MALDEVVARALLHTPRRAAIVRVDGRRRSAARAGRSGAAGTGGGQPGEQRGQGRGRRIGRGQRAAVRTAAVALAVVDHGPGIDAGRPRSRIRAVPAPRRPAAPTAGSDSGWRSPAASPKRWAARVVPTDTRGGGLTMTVTLPTAGSRRGGAVSRILVVDDDQPAAAGAADQPHRPRLRRRCWRRTVRDALAAATKQPPDLVIVDLGLPDMDGVEVIEGIRGWLAGAGHRAVRASSGTGQGARARRRRRRLRDQAVRHGRVAGADPGRLCGGRLHRRSAEVAGHRHRRVHGRPGRSSG